MFIIFKLKILIFLRLLLLYLSELEPPKQDWLSLVEAFALMHFFLVVVDRNNGPVHF